MNDKEVREYLKEYLSRTLKFVWRLCSVCGKKIRVPFDVGFGSSDDDIWICRECFRKMLMWLIEKYRKDVGYE